VSGSAASTLSGPQQEIRDLLEDFIEEDDRRDSWYKLLDDDDVMVLSDELCLELAPLLKKHDRDAKSIYEDISSGYPEHCIRSALVIQQRLGSTNYTLSGIHYYSLSLYKRLGVPEATLDVLRDEDEGRIHLDLIRVTRAIHAALLRTGIDPDAQGGPLTTGYTSGDHTIHSLQDHLTFFVLAYRQHVPTLIRIIEATDCTRADVLDGMLRTTIARPGDEDRIIELFNQGFISESDIVDLLSDNAALPLMGGTL
jgi:hypothetical protein